MPRLPRRLLLAYLLLLAASCVVRHRAASSPAPEQGAGVALVREVSGDRLTGHRVRIAYLDVVPAGRENAPRVVLLHGSPGGKGDFRSVLPRLSGRRVVVPDLPGFGASERDVADYSIRAHARYVVELLDRLDIERADLVGFSMGGGVALSVADLAPRRVRSITLLSAIGAQEYELLGDYRINHALHGVQLAGLWALRELTPHFGALDRTVLGIPYARNFYDTDQRPLRGILERYDGPMLILHGETDPLVPVAAAREHARLVPQSEVVITPESHFMLFEEGPRVASVLESFLEQVDRGEAPTRATADPARRAAAARPFDPASVPHVRGLPWLVSVTLLAASTFASEDLACVAAGLLVASGRLSFAAASGASLAGILAGDLGLVLLGRLFGRALLRRAPFKWLVTDAQLRASSDWFRSRGPAVILASRFVPGSRLPTFVAAGVFHVPMRTLALWFVLAATVWTPLLVGAAALVGTPMLGLLARFEAWALPAAIAGLLLVWTFVHLLPLALTHRGRRLLAGRWIRATRWEFWPPWIFYPPVVVWILWLGVRHRGLAVFTAANPAIEGGGFIAESKAAILSGLAAAGDAVARWRLLPAGTVGYDAVADLGLPLVLKPDAGQRGSGVAIVRSPAEAEAYLEEAPYDVIAQAYVPGVEFGVFYVRRPAETSGWIFSITEKTLPSVAGDGRRTLEELILDDPRAVAMSKVYLAKNADRLGAVVPDGERVTLVELGTHSRGAIFADGLHLRTPELEAAVDRISRAFPGFHFGRYDVRAASVEAFRRGEIAVIELNGVTSEATAIYDARRGLIDAYRTLFTQWRLAFEIGAENRARGARPARVSELLRLIDRYRATAGEHVDAVKRTSVAPTPS